MRNHYLIIALACLFICIIAGVSHGADLTQEQYDAIVQNAKDIENMKLVQDEFKKAIGNFKLHLKRAKVYYDAIPPDSPYVPAAFRDTGILLYNAMNNGISGIENNYSIFLTGSPAE